MAHSFFKKSISVPEDVLIREISGESVLLNLKSEVYYGLDDVGTAMWQSLESHPTVGDAYQSLLNRYEVEPDTLEKDLLNLIDKLVENELLSLHD